MKAFVLTGPSDKNLVPFFQEDTAAKILFVEGRAGELSRIFPGRSNAQKRKSLSLLDDNAPIFREIRLRIPGSDVLGRLWDDVVPQLK